VSPDSNPGGSGTRKILAGDIGATHSRLAVYHLHGHTLELTRQETCTNAERECLADILMSFVEQESTDLEAACIGIPAPIHAGSSVSFTNLPWSVNRDELASIVGTDRVALVNDVEASAAGIPELSPKDLICLRPGLADPAGNRVAISVGTGLGVSALTPTGHTFATEAGHTTFAPRRDLDYDLQSRLQREFGHVSWERVASGSALPWIHASLAELPSPGIESSEIVARRTTDPYCGRAIETVRRFIGAAAGNVALTLMATGGLFLCGGLATRILDEDSADGFLEAFMDKGRMRRLLERMPVHVAIDGTLALRGAARIAIASYGLEEALDGTTVGRS
jgi:glucokinase